jgi:hypothetical protein
MDDRFKQIIGSSKSKVSIDVDTNVGISLESDTRLVKPNTNPINTIVGVDEQFDLERGYSTLYRLSGKLNIITANELTQGDGGINRGTADTDWDPLFTEYVSNGTLVKTPTNWQLQICYPSDMIPNYPMWGIDKPVSLGMKVTSLTSNTPSGNRILLVVTTTQTHKLSVGDYIHLNDRVNVNKYQGIHKVVALGQNGENVENKITLETTWDGDTTNEMFLTRVVNVSNDDVLNSKTDTMVSFTFSDISGGTLNTDYILIKTVKEHGLGVNDYVELRKSSNGILNGFHLVENVVGDYEYTIKRKSVNTPTTVGYTYRRMDGTPCDYYVRQFEVLTGNNYDIYKGGFSSSIYPTTQTPELGVANGTWLYHLNKDINISSLISHRGGVVNELKICMVKKSGDKPYDWSNVTSHWDFNRRNTNGNELELISLRRTNGIGTVEKNTPKTLSSNGSKYIGDVVEYNRQEIKEKVITEVIFRFGVQTGVINNNNIPDNTSVLEDGTNTITPVVNPSLHEGYYYNPFKTLEIKKYSNYIETAGVDDNIDGVPSNYETYSDGSLAWRDLLTDGYIEEGVNGVDWPFMNGRHYIHVNQYLYIRRQAPYKVINQSDIITVDPNLDC